MYEIYVKPEADKIFAKLARKDPKKLGIIHKKLEEVRANPLHAYKFLRQPLHTFNRVHINSHFVLVFKINHQKRQVEVYNFDHHDNVYKWRPEPE